MTMTNEDVALGYVLGTLEPHELRDAEALLESGDGDFVAEVERARADIATLRHGLDLVARGARTTTTHERTWPSRIAAIAAAAAMVGGLVVFAATSDRGGGRPNVPPSLAAPLPGAANLDVLARDAVLIVTGTVTGVRDGMEGDLAYRVAQLRVDETIKGAPAAQVDAFDYTYGAPWVQNGARVLLFLTGSEGTAHASILQVLHGDAGSYEIRDGALDGASFTIEDVRRAARS